ncbi:MAG: nucleoside 2-deoxyribosyltransferase domain-containing protein [Zavarzinella sp.]
MGSVLFPTTIIPIDGPLVFLAGPIQGAPHWHAEAIKWFSENTPHVSVASPRRLDRSRDFDYAAQVDWETFHLRRAASEGVILFWLAREAESIPGRAYAQTSRFELAEWKVRHERDGVQLAVGIEDGFSGAKYIRHRFRQDCPLVPLVTSLAAVCNAAATLVGQTHTAPGTSPVEE